MSAIRMVSDCAVPPELYSSFSVCGTSRGDVSDDVGSQSVLANIRNIITSAFDKTILVSRLIYPLQDSAHGCELQKSLNLHMFGNGYQESIERDDGTCWRSDIPDSNGGHTRRDILNLLRMFLQAPVLQFVRRSDTTSLKLVSDLCLEEDPSHMESALRDETVILNNL